MRILALVLATFLLATGRGYLDEWIPIAIAQGQDSLPLARALERAERFDAALAAHPRLPGETAPRNPP